MSASLVGSEMCIRDSPPPAPAPTGHRGAGGALPPGGRRGIVDDDGVGGGSVGRGGISGSVMLGVGCGPGPGVHPVTRDNMPRPSMALSLIHI
eukprot:8993168-Alexandrium_andersonii.AAC.1